MSFTQQCFHTEWEGRQQDLKQYFHLLGHFHIYILLFLACQYRSVRRTTFINCPQDVLSPCAFRLAIPALIINNCKQKDYCSCRMNETPWAYLEVVGSPLNCFTLSFFFKLFKTNDLQPFERFIKYKGCVLKTKNVQPDWNMTFLVQQVFPYSFSWSFWVKWSLLKPPLILAKFSI